MENDVSAMPKQRLPGLFSRLRQIRVSRTALVCLFALVLTVFMFISMAFISPEAVQAASGSARSVLPWWHGRLYYL